MDRERIAVRPLAGIEFVILEQCYEVLQISDNCKYRLSNHASYALFRAAVETIGPKTDEKQCQINYLFMLHFQKKTKIDFNDECKF